MKQYLDLMQRILDEGVWVYNKRTGKRCLTIINADMEYNVGAGEFPLVTTRKSHWKGAIAELLGYLRGYSSAAEFRAIGCNTWNYNANENKAWLNNPYRKGEDDMGRVYGVQGRFWRNSEGQEFDQLKKIYDHLRDGYDDRSEIITFHNPGELHMGCLGACMHTHTFSLLDRQLYLTSNQRSNDTPLGQNFNQIQCFTFNLLMSMITNNEPKMAYQKIVNAHIYEDQIDNVKLQLQRKPLPPPKLIINPAIKTLEDIETWVTLDDFKVENYEYHGAIKFPFSV